MHKHHKMQSLISKHYSYSQSKDLLQVGRHCLISLLYQVIYDNKVKICNQHLISKFQGLMVRELWLNWQVQLLLFFAQRIFIGQNMTEKQISKQTILNMITQYNFIGKDIPQPVKTYHQHYQEDSSSLDYSSQSSDQSVTNIQAKNQLKTQGAFMQAFVPEILLSKDGQLKHQKAQILRYISSLTTPKSQLSIFCQKLKIEYPEYLRQKQNGIYEVTAVLEVDNYFTSYVSKKYKSIAKFANLKRAENQAALSLLQKVWTEYPESWQKFVSLKKKK